MVVSVPEHEDTLSLSSLNSMVRGQRCDPGSGPGRSGPKMAARAACVAMCRRLQQVKGGRETMAGPRRSRWVSPPPAARPARSPPLELLPWVVVLGMHTLLRQQGDR